MLGGNRQTEDEFFAASQKVLSGQSVEQLTEEHPEYDAQFEQMLRVVAALKASPSPALSTDAVSRLQKRVQLTALQRQLPSSPRDVHIPHLTIVRSNTEPEQYLKSARFRKPLLQSGAFQFHTRRAIALIAILILSSLSLIGILALQEGFFGKSPQIESYTGVVVAIEPNRWLLDDDSEMLIDNLTEIHGQPAVGARMTCIAEQLPGHERYHALEVWILTDSTPPPD